MKVGNHNRPERAGRMSPHKSGFMIISLHHNASHAPSTATVKTLHRQTKVNVSPHSENHRWQKHSPQRFYIQMNKNWADTCRRMIRAGSSCRTSVTWWHQSAPFGPCTVTKCFWNTCKHVHFCCQDILAWESLEMTFFTPLIGHRVSVLEVWCLG